MSNAKLREQIKTNLMPELALLENETDREMVISVFEEAIVLSGWKEKGIEKCDLGAGYLGDACPEKLFDHTRHVTSAVAAVFNAMSPIFSVTTVANRQNLIAGALMHDVGKFLETEIKDGCLCHSDSWKLWRHPMTGAYLAKKHGFNDNVVHMILVHSNALSPEGRKATMTPESIILKYVDEMCFCYVEHFYLPGN